jgi:hypothetical protein
LFAGGSGSSPTYKNTVDAYDTSLTQSTPTALSVARDFLAGASVGNYALFAGGQSSSSSYSNAVDAYDTSLTQSTPTALSVARGMLAGASVGNYALFAGGYGSSPTHKDTVDAYNASLVRSTPTALSAARRRFAGASAGNYALFAGGYSGNFRDTVDAYTPQASVARLYMPVGTKYQFGSDQEQTATASVVDILPPLTGYIKYEKGVI